MQCEYMYNVNTADIKGLDNNNQLQNCWNRLTENAKKSVTNNECVWKQDKKIWKCFAAN